MVIGEGGPLYSSLRLPVQNYLAMLAGVSMPQWVHAEQGMHWTTILQQSLLALWLLFELPKRRFSPIHTVAFATLMFFLTLTFPFECVYVPFLDIFHNFPVEGMMSTLMYGWWRFTWGLSGPALWLFNSVIGRNGVIGPLGLVFAYIIAADNYYNNPSGPIRWRFLNLDRKSWLLLAGWVGGFALWILLPLVPSFYNPLDHFKGTQWFPQDIYVWYAWSPANPRDLYDIVAESWYPNPLVRIINISTKVLTVYWVAHTFTPRVVE